LRRRFLSISLYIYYYIKVLSPLGGAIHDPRDSIYINFNLLATRMLHAKYQCFQPVVHEKTIFEDLSKFSFQIFFIRGHPLYLNKSESLTPKHCFLSSLVEIGPVVLEKKCLKEKVDGQTTDHAPSHKLSWPLAR